MDKMAAGMVTPVERPWHSRPSFGLLWNWPISGARAIFLVAPLQTGFPQMWEVRLTRISHPSRISAVAWAGDRCAGSCQAGFVKANLGMVKVALITWDLLGSTSLPWALFQSAARAGWAEKNGVLQGDALLEIGNQTVSRRYFDRCWRSTPSSSREIPH